MDNVRFVKLSEAATIVDSLHETPTYSEKGFPMVRAKDIIGGRLNLKDCARVTEDVFEKFTKRYAPKKGDIVFSRVGIYLGKSSFVNSDHKFCLGQNTVVIKPNINNIYLFYCLQSSFVRNQIKTLTIGSAYKTLSLKNLEKLKIPFFEEDIQRIIVYIMNSLDSKIELNNELILTLESLALSLFHSWFARFDPFQDGEYADSEFGLIPKGWAIGRLEDVAEVIDCLHIKKPEREDKGNYLLQVYNIGENGKLDLTNPFFVSDDIYYIWISRIEVKKGDIIISKTGRVGAVAQIPNIRAAIGRNLVCIRPNSDIMNPEYLKELLLSRFMKNEIRIRTSSGTILQSLHVKDIKKLRIIVPPEKISRDFQDIIEPLHERIITITEENLVLSSLRDLLLPQLLFGNLRIKNIKKFLEKINKIN